MAQRKQDSDEYGNTAHHVWDPEGRRCLRCGILMYQASDIKYGCSRQKAKVAGRRKKKPRKGLIDS